MLSGVGNVEHQRSPARYAESARELVESSPALIIVIPSTFYFSLNKVIIIIKSLWMLSISPCKYPGAFFFSRRNIPVDVHMTDFYSRL